MAKEKNIKFKVDELVLFKTVITTYEIIAAASMQKVRSSVLSSRDFHSELITVFREVRAAYKSNLERIERRQKILSKVIPAAFLKSSRTAYVFLSANTGLYGGIIFKTFELFSKEFIEKKPDEVAIIGRVGQAMFKNAFPERLFAAFDFPDTAISEPALKDISDHLRAFGEVVVFHGSFKSILNQIPVFYSVSGSPLSSEIPEVKIETKYRFEPALEEIFKFFETEIFAVLLGQVFHESRLAKLASRLLMLDSASGNVERFLNKAIFEQQKDKHRVFNRKQINSYNAFAFW